MTHSDPENPLDPDVPPAGPVGPCIPTADQVPEPPVVIRSIEPSPKFSILPDNILPFAQPHVHNLSRYLLY
jgi:hypothetical protein